MCTLGDCVSDLLVHVVQGWKVLVLYVRVSLRCIMGLDDFSKKYLNQANWILEFLQRYVLPERFHELTQVQY